MPYILEWKKVSRDYFSGMSIGLFKKTLKLYHEVEGTVKGTEHGESILFISSVVKYCIEKGDYQIPVIVKYPILWPLFGKKKYKCCDYCADALVAIGGIRRVKSNSFFSAKLLKMEESKRMMYCPSCARIIFTGFKWR